MITVFRELPKDGPADQCREVAKLVYSNAGLLPPLNLSRIQ
jgi:hypothetical protein